MFWLILVFLLTCLYLYSNKCFKYFSSRGVPTLPPVPILGNLAAVTFGKENFVKAMAAGYDAFKEQRYFGLYQYLAPTLVPRDPELIQQIMVQDFNAFPERGLHIDDDCDPLFGRTFVMYKGSKWRSMRAILTPTFSGSRCRNMIPLMEECVTEVMNYLQETVTSKQKVDIAMLTQAYMNDVIASCAFGYSVKSLKDPDNVINKLGKKAIIQDTSQIMKFFGYENMKAVMKFLKVKIIPTDDAAALSRLFKSALTTRREKLAPRRPDFIQNLVDADQELSDDEMVAQAVLFYSAGYDTTSNLICYFLYEMASNMRVQDKLYAELASLSTASDDEDLCDVSALEYLDMCISEVLRLWPIISLADRRSVTTYDFGPVSPGSKTHLIAPAGIHIWFPVYSIHRDEKYWPEPNVCEPERFSKERKANIVPYTYMPFGFGPRNCIGSRFAILAAKTFLAKFLLKYKVTTEVESTKIDPRAFVLRPANGHNLSIELRQR